MSGMESGDLAPGDSISQDGSLREFRYSQFTPCPSAPFNTPESECLPSPFRCSGSLDAAPLGGSERDGCEEEEGGSSSGALCSWRGLGGGGSQQGRFRLSGSDSLGLPLFDDCCGLVDRGSSGPRRVFCDPRLLDEETQVADFGVLSVEAVGDSSPVLKLQSAPQGFELDNVTEEMDLPTLRKEASEVIQTTDGELQERTPLLGTEQEDGHASNEKRVFGAVEDYGDIAQRWHNRKRVLAFAATNHQSSNSLNGCMLKKLKQATASTVESGGLHPSQPRGELVEIPTIYDQKNRGQLSEDATSPCSDAETTEEGASATIHTDDICESSLLRRKLNYACPRDIMSFWQPVPAPKRAEERQWSCPRKYRPRGRQRTMDAWVE